MGTATIYTLGCKGREIEGFLGNLSGHYLKAIGRRQKLCYNHNTLTLGDLVI